MAGATDMMIVKFSKTGSAAYIPHLDTLRAFIRILTRAGIEVEYSKGYNPHMCLYFSSPSPLGLNTVAEYCTIETNYENNDFTEKFNRYSPENLICLNSKKVLVNPNFANILIASEYEIEIEGLKNFKDLIKGLTLEPFIIDYENKGEKKSKDFSKLIYSITQTDDTLTSIFSSGAENLRHDIFINKILELTNLKKVKKVLKTARFYNQNNKLINADNLF